MTISSAAVVRIGLLGYGYSGRTFPAPLVTAVAGLELRVIRSRQPAGMRPGDAGWGVDGDPLVVFDTAGRTCHLPTVPGNQRQYHVGIRDALAMMATVEAGVASSRSRSAMPVPLTGDEIERRQFGA